MVKELKYLEERDGEILVSDRDRSVHALDIFQDLWIDRLETDSIASKYGISQEAVREFESYCTNGAYNDFKSRLEQHQTVTDQRARLREKHGYGDREVDHNMDGPAGFIHEVLEGKDYTLSAGKEGFVISPFDASQTLKVVRDRDKYLIEGKISLETDEESFGSYLLEQFQDLEMD